MNINDCKAVVIAAAYTSGFDFTLKFNIVMKILSVKELTPAFPSLLIMLKTT